MKSFGFRVSNRKKSVVYDLFTYVVHLEVRSWADRTCCFVGKLNQFICLENVSMQKEFFKFIHDSWHNGFI